MEFLFAFLLCLGPFAGAVIIYEWYKNRQFRKNCEKYSSENYVKYDDEYL